MVNGDYSISPESWERLSTDEKLWLIYDTNNNNQIRCAERCAECQLRFKEAYDRITKLENKRKTDIGIASSTGFLGGFIAVVTKKLFGF